MPPDAAALAAARRIVEEVLADHASRAVQRPTAVPTDGADETGVPAPVPTPAHVERPDTPAWRAARRIVEEVLAAHDASPPGASVVPEPSATLEVPATSDAAGPAGPGGAPDPADEGGGASPADPGGLPSLTHGATASDASVGPSRAQDDDAVDAPLFAPDRDEERMATSVASDTAAEGSSGGVADVPAHPDADGTSGSAAAGVGDPAAGGASSSAAGGGDHVATERTGSTDLERASDARIHHGAAATGEPGSGEPAAVPGPDDGGPRDGLGTAPTPDPSEVEVAHAAVAGAGRPDPSGGPSPEQDPPRAGAPARADELPADAARRIVAEVLAARGDAGSTPPDVRTASDAARVRTHDAVPVSGDPEPAPRAPEPASDGDVFPEELFATIVRPAAPNADGDDAADGDTSGSDRHPDGAGDRSPHGTGRSAREPDHADVGPRVEDVDGDDRGSAGPSVEVTGGAAASVEVPGGGDGDVLDGDLHPDDFYSRDDRDERDDVGDAQGPPPIPDAARRRTTAGAGSGGRDQQGPDTTTPIERVAPTDPTAPSAVAARIVAEVVAQRSEPARDDGSVPAIEERTERLDVVGPATSVAATDEAATDRTAADAAATDAAATGETATGAEHQDPAELTVTRSLPTDASTTDRDHPPEADEPTEELDEDLRRAATSAAMDGDVLGSPEVGAGPIARTEALDPHGVEEPTEEVAVAPPPDAGEDLTTTPTPVGSGATLDPSPVDPWPDETWADEVWPSGDDEGWSTDRSPDGAFARPTRHAPHGVDGSTDRPPVVVRPEEMPDLEDIPPPPRRTGRWLLTTVLGAIGLALLFPLAVGALLELVSLS